jgi:hypothetical protein
VAASPAPADASHPHFTFADEGDLADEQRGLIFMPTPRPVQPND